MLTSSQHKTPSARDSMPFLPRQPYPGCSARPGLPGGSAQHIPSLVRATLAPASATPRRYSPPERTDCLAHMPSQAGDRAGTGQHAKRPRSPSLLAGNTHSTSSLAAVLVHTVLSHHAQQTHASLHHRQRYSNEQPRQEVPPPTHDEPVQQERPMPLVGSRAPGDEGPVS